jgi:hypothetical protein
VAVRAGLILTCEFLKQLWVLVGVNTDGQRGEGAKVIVFPYANWFRINLLAKSIRKLLVASSAIQ